MSLTETTNVDQITVTENGIVLYREITRVFRDDVSIAETYHRYSLLPGQDLTGVPQNVADICNVAWTPEVIAAYQAIPKPPVITPPAPDMSAPSN